MKCPHWRTSYVIPLISMALGVACLSYSVYFSLQMDKWLNTHPRNPVTLLIFMVSLLVGSILVGYGFATGIVCQVERKYAKHQREADL